MHVARFDRTFGWTLRKRDHIELCKSSQNGLPNSTGRCSASISSFSVYLIPWRSERAALPVCLSTRYTFWPGVRANEPKTWSHRYSLLQCRHVFSVHRKNGRGKRKCTRGRLLTLACEWRNANDICVPKMVSGWCTEWILRIMVSKKTSSRKWAIKASCIRTRLRDSDSDSES